MVKRGRGGAREDKERVAELGVVLARLETTYGYKATTAGDVDCSAPGGKVGRALVRALTLTAKAEEVRSSEFAGGSELGPLAMADKVVLCTCERQGRWECESE
jgi:hypothetical protein